MNIAVVIPPFTQFNTIYPSSVYLSQYLKDLGHEARPVDLSLELILELLSSSCLKKVVQDLDILMKRNVELPECALFFIDASDDYITTIDTVMNFLKGKNDVVSTVIAARQLLPEGPRFVAFHEHQEILEKSYGKHSVIDRAKHMASLYLDDISDVFTFLDPHFGLSRYGEKLAASISSFSPLYEAFKNHHSFVRSVYEHVIEKFINSEKWDLVCISIPFPGNVFSALLLGKMCKDLGIPVVIGGGYVNTELRSLEDKRVFEFTDYISFDDGEKPLETLLEFLSGKRERTALCRVWSLHEGVIYKTNQVNGVADPAFKKLKGPSYKEVKTQDYFSMVEMVNPVQRLWSDFKWNKLILAHGCYWKKCTFCDVHLDYIGRFDPGKAEDLVDQMQRVIAQTGQTGFHFVDEAAPPALLKSMCEEILKRKLRVQWWGNLRFDQAFTKDLTDLMASAGCIAVTGGLEVASDRLLALINKGVTLKTVAKATKNFHASGIMVHAYLMYGFPSQTVQETIDSLEVVRQLFFHECLHSAHWHRFSATVHSPVGKNPEKFGIKLKFPQVEKGSMFSLNDLEFEDSIQVDHDFLGIGLRKALYNYMHAFGIESDVREWFEGCVPKTTLKKNFISSLLT